MTDSEGSGEWTTFSLLNDEPVAAEPDDQLGAALVAKRLAQLLLTSRASTPFTLAVDAGWGMGKSSLMRLVDAELQKEPGVHTVWYNAWTSTGADALEGLIKSVLMRFDRRVLRRGLRRATDQRALIRAARALLVLLAGPLGVSRLVDELWSNLSAKPEARNDMRDAIKDLTQEWAETGEFTPRRMLVVFIDDLDRCSEETVLAVCEAVKVYLDVPGLAFAIGGDRSALGPNGLLRDLSPAGAAFMEKIFQTSYRVPAADGRDFEAYIRRCMRATGIHRVVDDELVPLLAERSGRNPRRVKRLLNGFVLEATLNPMWAGFGSEAVIRTLLLQYFYADFYRMMADPGPGAGDVVAEFRRYREVRRILLAGPGAAVVGDDRKAQRMFEEYEVAPPHSLDQDTPVAALARLEQYLPSGFPALTTDQAFISLLDELLRLPRSAELLMAIRNGPKDRVPSTLSQLVDVEVNMEMDTAEEYAGLERGATPTRLGGLRILWVDDRPENNTDLVGLLMEWGAGEVDIARNQEEADRAIAARPPDLLISDVSRGRAAEAGFTYVERLVRERRYRGDVVFFTGRVTPAREARARELNALGITTDPYQLLRLVDEAADRRR
ncbi:P-loop NTPase fold protein [Streptomyces sp. NPDC021225]|uniref:P-loop NTPase fold protein n=1 Tax=Streptomyces sp. NPDC021225 TaxID=3365121 RepID=UPI003792C81C